MTHHLQRDVAIRYRFPIKVDVAVAQLIGTDQFVIGSRYDITPIPFRVTESDKAQSRTTLITVSPEDGTRGPELRVSLLVKSSLGRTAAAVTGSAFGLVLLAVPNFLPDTTPIGIKAAIYGIGALLVAFLAVVGLKRG